MVYNWCFSGGAGNRTCVEIAAITAILEVGGAESGAPDLIIPHIAPELVALIDVWPRLSEPIKAGILALVRAARGEDRHTSTSTEPAFAGIAAVPLTRRPWQASRILPTTGSTFSALGTVADGDRVCFYPIRCDR